MANSKFISLCFILWLFLKFVMLFEEIKSLIKKKTKLPSQQNELFKPHLLVSFNFKFC